MSRLAELRRRAKRIYQTEGLVSLVRQACAFFAYCLFEHRTYYIYLGDTEDILALHEADFRPKIDAFVFKVVSSNEEADELEAHGYEFRSQVHNARKRLDSGAVAFCIFVDNELAHIGWVVMTQQAKDSLDEPPYRVDFSNKEGCAAGIWTNPKYRRKGLSSYGYMKRLRYMLDNGIVTDRTAINTLNIPGQEYQTKVSCSICAEGRYLRVLWWKWWKEKPLTAGE